MPRIRRQRRRAVPHRCPRQQPGPAAIDDGRRQVQQQAGPRRLEHCRMVPMRPGPLQDGERGQDDEHALDDRGEELGLVVPVRVVFVGWPGGEAEGDERDHARRHVHHALQRVGVEGGAAGDATTQPPSGRARAADHDRPQRDASQSVHHTPASPVRPSALETGISRGHIAPLKAGGARRGYTEKYFARGFSTTMALVDCSGCSCHSSESEMPIRSASSRRSSGSWSSSFGQAG